jgi:glyoxylase-like metal-dependent hydrolase (beta-lactamase superfamily II)
VTRVLSIAVTALALAAPALAQSGSSATVPVFPERAETVGPIEILELRPNLHMLVGPAGSNAVVHAGPEGVLIVDTMTAELGGAVVSAIQRLSNRPILQIVSTHSDLDHVGGNEAVRKAGAYFSTANTRDGGGAGILAFENTLHRMSADGSPHPRYGWPTDSFFVDKKDLFLNGEPVQVLHQPAAHTDGDAMVHFRKSDVLVTGDVFTPNRYPVIKLDEGGSINGLIDGLNRILDIAVPAFNEEGGTIIIPGHGRICDESDVSDYRDMVTIVRDRVKAMVDAKATLEQVKAARPTRDYDGVFSTQAYTGDMFVEAVYRSLAPAPAAPAGGRR